MLSQNVGKFEQEATEVTKGERPKVMFQELDHRKVSECVRKCQKVTLDADEERERAAKFGNDEGFIKAGWERKMREGFTSLYKAG
jgi:hypothetical protein